MKNSYYIGNWKMNGSKNLVDDYVDILSKKNLPESSKIIICPPFTLLDYAESNFNKMKNIELGAQNISSVTNGANTGSISAELVSPYCRYIIIGHSEIREKGETNKEIQAKLKLCSEYNLIPIVCIGEKIFNKNLDNTLEFVEQQLESIYQNINFKNIIIAYEPVWAIGNDKFCDPERASKVLEFIHNKAKILNNQIDTSVIYGGSVNIDNYKKYLEKQNINGLLIGRSSLDPQTFYKIINNS
ncbi:MAG: triose-phosphate isomerase [Chloroflexi bacterium]|nr:triose-phosphate isomerase [Chloroflexota bacterium]